jgi:hypothetical protein
MFKGRLLGINLQEEEYENRDGEVKVRLNVCQVVDAQLVRDGKVKPRKKKEIAGKMSTAPSASADAMDDIDVPFV